MEGSGRLVTPGLVNIDDPVAALVLGAPATGAAGGRQHPVVERGRLNTVDEETSALEVGAASRRLLARESEFVSPVDQDRPRDAVRFCVSCSSKQHNPNSRRQA